MRGADLVALAPHLVLAATAIVVLLAIAWRRHRGTVVGLTLLGLALTLASLGVALDASPRQVTSLVRVDGFTVFMVGLLVASSLTVCLFAAAGDGRRAQREELYLLLVLATFGGAVLAASTHFASLFLGLELSSVSLYALIAYPRRRATALEAGVKYLLLAGASSAFLLFGMALCYVEAGSLELVAVARMLDAGTPVALAGLALMLTGIGFKLALVPFHLWAPDVYSGAPAPVAAFIASVSKAGIFAVVLRFLLGAEGPGRAMLLGLGVVAVASMLVGNLLALLERDVKRILAYSSVAHFGYLLVPVLAAGRLGLTAAAFYLVAYLTTVLAAFGVVTVVCGETGEARLEAVRGLFWRRPWIAALLAASLLSLAGIPVTAGFLGKLYLLLAGVDASLWPLVFALVLGSAIGLFYYLRVIVHLFAVPRDLGAVPTTVQPSLALPLAMLSVPLVGLGIYPAPLIELIETLVLASLLG